MPLFSPIASAILNDGINLPIILKSTLQHQCCSLIHASPPLMMKFLVATISIRDSTEKEREADGDPTILKNFLLGTKMKCFTRRRSRSMFRCCAGPAAVHSRSLLLIFQPFIQSVHPFECPSFPIPYPTKQEQAAFLGGFVFAH